MYTSIVLIGTMTSFVKRENMTEMRKFLKLLVKSKMTKVVFNVFVREMA